MNRFIIYIVSITVCIHIKMSTSETIANANVKIKLKFQKLLELMALSDCFCSKKHSDTDF